MFNRLTACLALMAVLVVTPNAFAEEGWKRLIAPAELAALQAAGDVTVIDIRDPKAYATAHLPGAFNAPYPAWRGPAENPGQPISDERLTAILQALGLTPLSRAVVVHAGTDQTDFGAAARVYWTLKSAGMSEIAILNGGVRSWVGSGQPLAIDAPVAAPSAAKFALSGTWMADRHEVAAIAAGSAAGRLIDARPEPFLKGKASHPAASRPGTLPGAESVVFDRWFGGDRTELSPSDRISALAGADLNGAESTAPIVSFCNTGHWAAINWFALSEMAGLENVKLYPESMVGWTRGGGETAVLP